MRIQYFIMGLLVFLATACTPAQNVSAIPAELVEVANIHHPESNRYTSGQPTMQQLGAFSDLGVTTVINLRSTQEMQDIPEHQWTHDLNMSYYQLPVSSAADLTPELVADLHQILQRHQDDNVLIHCASSNRVGAMMALRAKWHQQASTEEALAIGRQHGLKSLENHVTRLLNP